MKYINLIKTKPIKIKLTRKLGKHIKRGNPWIFSDAVESVSSTEKAGQLALLIEGQNDIISTGFYNGKSNLVFRALTFDGERIDDQWIEAKIDRATEIRRTFLSGEASSRSTNCFRLINGEGDGLPGLVCDVYDRLLVIQTDGEAASLFWNPTELAKYILNKNPSYLTCAYQKYKSSKDRDKQLEKGKALVGDCPETVIVKENGIKFEVNIIDGAKTGLFLDQREGRSLVGKHAYNKDVLNVFGYTGGFSLYAGSGGAKSVTTVDLAPKAVLASECNWKINQLPNIHRAVCLDAFEFLKNDPSTFDFIIVDPPSFAPSKDDVENAKVAYQNLFCLALKKLRPGGLFVASSCSGHIDFDIFSEILHDSFQSSKRRATALSISGQSFDHPFPYSCPELRYLKFFLFSVA